MHAHASARRNFRLVCKEESMAIFRQHSPAGNSRTGLIIPFATLLWLASISPMPFAQSGWRPEKPVEIVVPLPAGSTLDSVSYKGFLGTTENALKTQIWTPCAPVC